MNSAFDVLSQWGPHRGPHGPMGPQGPMGPDGWATGMMPWGGSGMTGFGFLWSLVALLLVVAILAAVAYLAFRLYEAREAGGDADALSVLRRRYAAGEIDDEEFDRRRSRLDGGHSS